MTDLRRIKWIAYAATVWAFVFACISFYWAAGGRLGVNTLGEGMAALADDPEVIAFTWITGVLKLLAGLFPLALTQSFERFLPRWIWLAGSWSAGLLFLLYGLGNFIQHGLMLTGNIPVAQLLGTPSAVRWHLLFWDPFWFLGGVLFVLTAWYYSRRSK
jgi:hypothetical protein